MTPKFDWTKEDVEILKSCCATDVGRMALGMIVQRLAGIGTSSFSTDPNLMAFNEGRRWIGIEINNAITIPTDKLVRKPDEPRSHRPISATERAERAAVERPSF